MPTFGQTRICERSERNERKTFYVLHFEKMRFKLLGQTHYSGVCGWIFDFSTLLDSCGSGQLVGAVFKARSARLEKARFARFARFVTEQMRNFSSTC